MQTFKEQAVDFDWEDILSNISYVIPIIIFLLINVFFKKQQEQQNRKNVVRSLLSDIKHNQNLMEAAAYQRQKKKFKTGTWRKNKAKMDYVSPDLYSALSDAFGIAEEFNREIDAAKKQRMASYIASLDTERMRKPLERCQQGLELWVLENKDQKKAD